MVSEKEKLLILNKELSEQILIAQKKIKETESEKNQLRADKKKLIKEASDKLLHDSQKEVCNCKRAAE